MRNYADSYIQKMTAIETAIKKGENTLDGAAVVTTTTEIGKMQNESQQMIGIWWLLTGNDTSDSYTTNH